MNKRDKALKEIKEEVIKCRKCLLYKSRALPVIGEGNHRAKIVLIGEAPGAEESKAGRPFCGQAGRVLDGLLESAGVKRRDVYIANILKDRPPQNRNPLPSEITACTPYLLRQINIIKPKVIAALGNFSTSFIMKEYGLEEKIEGISKIHGRFFEVGAPFGKIKIVPLYHPAVAVYNNLMRDVLVNDFKILSKLNGQKKYSKSSRRIVRRS